MTTINFSSKFLGKTLEAECVKQVKTAQSTLDTVVNKSCRGSEWLGWWNYPAASGWDVWSKVEKKLNAINVDYDCVVVIGIGGSYLGTRAAEVALRSPFASTKQKPILYCGHHLSETAFQEFLSELEGRQPLVCMISKSGTTTEPGLCFRLVRSWLETHLAADADRRIVAITDQAKGALRKLADEKNWPSFVIPDDIGGRFSVLTPVGTVPLALAGFDVTTLLKGAAETFESISTNKDHAVFQYAAARFALHEAGKSIEVLSTVDPKLLYFTEWWKQLFGESEGKENKGLFPSSMIFTTDLHSLGQYAQDGKRTMCETFFTFGAQDQGHVSIPQFDNNLDGLNYLAGKTMHDVNEAARKGTLLAHHDGGVPCMELAFEKLSPYTIGSAFAFFQSACAISALMLDVNPFDQPGVEDYKKNLFALMNKPGFESEHTKITSRLDS